MNSQLPKKMKQDAIVEALFEVRFDSSDIGEVVVGRLSDVDSWADYTSVRLPQADIPERIRVADAAFKHVPTVEKTSPDKTRSIRIGPRVISYHVYEPYPGGDSFEKELNNMLACLFDKIKDIQVSRLGFRCVNFLTVSKHKINGLNDLSLNLSVGGKQLLDNVNLAFMENVGDKHTVVSKLASPQFLQPGSPTPTDLIAVIDIDIFTPEPYVSNDVNSLSEWISQARIYEKTNFFSFFSDELKNSLVEE